MPVSRPETEIEIEVELEDYDDVRDRLIYKIEIESNVFPPTQTTQCQCVLGFGSSSATDVEAIAAGIAGFRAGATAFGFSTLVDPFDLPAPRPGDRLVENWT